MNDRKNSGQNAGRDDEDTRSRQGLRQSADPASGFVADDNAGYSSVGGQNQQQAATSGRYTNFNSAPPESNVGPPGAPQTSHGNAGGPVPGSTVEKAEAANTGNRQSAEVAMAGGGNPSDAAAADGGMANRAGTDDDSDKLSERLGRGAESSGRPGDAPR